MDRGRVASSKYATRFSSSGRIGVASLCLGLVVPGIVSPLWGVVLGFVVVFLLWVAWIIGQVLADRSAAQAAANRRGAEAGDMRSMPGDRPADMAPPVARDLPGSPD